MTTLRLSSGASQDEVRRHNLSRLLRHVHIAGPTSRAELTARMGLNRSTIGALTGELMAAGLVTERLPDGRSQAGRPSLVVVPETHRAYVVALDIGVEHLVAARVGLGGVVLARRELAHPALPVQDLAGVVQRTSRLIRSLVRSADPCGVFIGVGAAVPGAVRTSDGLVRFGPNLGWVDQPYGEMLTAKLGQDTPVAVGNDANLGALAEARRGVALGRDDVIYLTGEVGIGAGMITRARALTGAGGYAGEAGHMVVNPRGRRCRCGARGCWETEIGEEALLIAADRSGNGGHEGVLEVLAAAANGEPAASRAVRSVGRWVGIGVGNLINLFNPEMVIFGGVLRDIFPAVEHLVRKHLTEIALAAPLENVDLVVPGLGDDSILLGAAELAFTPLLDDPLATLATRST